MRLSARRHIIDPRGDVPLFVEILEASLRIEIYAASAI
jgi:hypothetical protein